MEPSWILTTICIVLLAFGAYKYVTNKGEDETRSKDRYK